MTILTANTEPVAFLAPNAFQFTLSKTPLTNYYTQTVNIPGITLPPVNLPTPVISVPIPGEHLQFGVFSASFKIDQEMQNYLELYNWMISVSEFSANCTSAAAWKASVASGDGPFSDGNLVVLNAQNNPVIQVSFQDMWPTQLGGLDFDVKKPADAYLLGSVTFAYQSFTLAALT